MNKEVQKDRSPWVCVGGGGPCSSPQPLRTLLPRSLPAVPHHQEGASGTPSGTCAVQPSEAAPEATDHGCVLVPPRSELGGYSISAVIFPFRLLLHKGHVLLGFMTLAQFFLLPNSESSPPLSPRLPFCVDRSVPPKIQMLKS